MKISKREARLMVVNLYKAAKGMSDLRDAAIKGGSKNTIFHTGEYEKLVEATQCLDKLFLGEDNLFST